MARITTTLLHAPTCCPPPLPGSHPPTPQTILDGEMVVDENMEEERWDRRFLAYDMVMCNGHPLVDRPWMVGGGTGA